jgi:hypothetical protein
MINASEDVVMLTDAQRVALAEERATCPFIASAVADGKLEVRNAADNPLASVEDVRRLGNGGGGDLGELLAIFASGNHRFMRGDSGSLDRLVPSGFFSLEFPGSQGSHPGHSGILESSPDKPGSGRLSPAEFTRLIGRATGGLIKRSEVGRFIAENLRRDPNAKVSGERVALLLASDLSRFLDASRAALLGKLRLSDQQASAVHRDWEAKLTKLLGEDNLVGSAGEWGLLFAFLANKPGALEVDGEPTVTVEDLRGMFVLKRLPPGFETWKKSRIDWVIHTTALLISAGKEYLEQRE